MNGLGRSQMRSAWHPRRLLFCRKDKDNGDGLEQLQLLISYSLGRCGARDATVITSAILEVRTQSEGLKSWIEPFYTKLGSWYFPQYASIASASLVSVSVGSELLKRILDLERRASAGTLPSSCARLPIWEGGEKYLISMKRNCALLVENVRRIAAVSKVRYRNLP